MSKPNRRLRDQLERKVSQLLARPLADLQSRGWLPPALGGQSTVPISRDAHLDRMREVVERDRALREASPVQPTPEPPPPFEVALTAIESRSLPLGVASSSEPDSPVEVRIGSNVEVTDETSATHEDGLIAIEEEVVTPVEAAPSLSSPAPRKKSACKEPIRTRTMAKLLLSQGHPQRALSIYEALIADGANDPALLAEADALRSLQT